MIGDAKESVVPRAVYRHGIMTEKGQTACDGSSEKGQTACDGSPVPTWTELAENR